MSTLVTARIPDDMAKSLEFIAKSFERPKSFCIVKALKSYIAEAMEEIEDTMDGEICLQRENDERITWEEAERLAAEIRDA